MEMELYLGNTFPGGHPGTPAPLVLRRHVGFDPVAAQGQDGPPPLEPTTRLDDLLLTSTSSSIPHLSHPQTMSTAVDGELAALPKS